LKGIVPAMKSTSHYHTKTCYLKKFIISILTLFLTSSIAGQQNEPVYMIEQEFRSISIKTSPRSFIPVNFKLVNDYRPSLLFEDSFSKRPVPPGKVHKKIILRFTITNPQESEDSCYFFPDFCYSNVQLYQVKNDRLFPLPSVSPPIKDSVSFRLIKIAAKDTMHLLAECFLVKTYVNYFKPVLIDTDYIHSFALELQQKSKNVTLFTYVFCGLMLMMILFSIANYIPGRNRDFLYYAGYAFFLGVMLFTKQYYYNRSINRGFLFESYLDFQFQCIGICFFMAFMIRFLETKKFFPFLHKLYVSGIVFLSAVIALYTYLHYGTNSYNAEYILENYITKGVLLIMILIFLVYAAAHWQYKMMRYLFWGNFFFILFSLASLINILNFTLIRLPGILHDSMVLYEIGLVTELVFFLVALSFKNRHLLVEQVQERERLKMENDRKELEKQVAVMHAHQEERERISADIHDELGSGMTTIRLMSEIAKNKLKDNVPVEIEKISGSANEVLNKMNAIIWSMNSQNDNLDNLVSYIRAYAIDFFDGTDISCKVLTPDNISNLEISGDKRRNLFLCLKETLNNTMKHSHATRVEISIEINTKLRIRVADNGAGIQKEKISQFGNGLRNIERRMKTIGGFYSIQNNGGTVSLFDLPLR
jgi:signal transduction histidine kinase